MEVNFLEIIKSDSKKNGQVNILGIVKMQPAKKVGGRRISRKQKPPPPDASSSRSRHARRRANAPECAVCYEQVQRHQRASTHFNGSAKCGGVFHRSCLQASLDAPTSQGRCPYCRSSLRMEDVVEDEEQYQPYVPWGSDDDGWESEDDDGWENDDGLGDPASWPYQEGGPFYQGDHGDF